MHQKRQDSAGAGDNISVKITGRDKQNMPRFADVKAAREAVNNLILQLFIRAVS